MRQKLSQHVRKVNARMHHNQIAHLKHTGIYPYMDKLPAPGHAISIRYTDEYTRGSLRHHWMAELNRRYHNDPPFALSFSTFYRGIKLTITNIERSAMPTPPQAFTEDEASIDSAATAYHQTPIQRAPTMEEEIEAGISLVFQSPEYRLEEALKFIEGNPEHPDAEEARRAIRKLREEIEEKHKSPPSCPNLDNLEEQSSSLREEDADEPLNAEEQSLMSLLDEDEKESSKSEEQGNDKQ